MFPGYLTLIFLTVFLICPGPGAALADPGPGEIDLSGTWMIRLGDDPDWSEEAFHRAGAWDSITLPGFIARYSKEKTGRYSGVAWLKKYLYIPDDWSGKKVGLTLGRIAHADETFFNGVHIGEGGRVSEPRHSMWYTPRFYLVPDHLIKAGAVNVITVKVWYHTFGDVSGRLALSDYSRWQKDRNHEYFIRTILNFISIGAGIPIFVVFVMFYARRPGSTEYLYQFLQLLFSFFIMLDLCWPFRYPGGIVVRERILAYSWMALNVFHPLFLHHLYFLKRKKIERLLLGYLCLATPLYFLVTPASSRFWGIIVLCVAVATGFYNLACHAQGLMTRKPYAKLFASLGMVAILGSLHDGMIYASKLLYVKPVILGYHAHIMVFPTTAAFLFIGSSVVLIIRFFIGLRRNEKMNLTLEEKVGERTRSLIAMTEELERQNVRFAQMAIRDSLTGLYNHAALCDRLDEIFLTSRKNRHPLAVAMIDVDDFKQVNDAWGHQAGDRVLVEIARILRTGIREYDFLDKYQGHRMEDNRDYDLAGRYGGDEFMLVLPQCDHVTALKVMARISEQISGIRFDGHPGLRANCSFGLAVLNPEIMCAGSDKLIALADRALYKSKNQGKNRIYCYVYENRS